MSCLSLDAYLRWYGHKWVFTNIWLFGANLPHSKFMYRYIHVLHTLYIYSGKRMPGRAGIRVIVIMLQGRIVRGARRWRRRLVSREIAITYVLHLYNLHPYSHWRKPCPLQRYLPSSPNQSRTRSWTAGERVRVSQNGWRGLVYALYWSSIGTLIRPHYV